MTHPAIAVSLALGVAASWLGVLGFLRLANPLDRLHAVTFVNAVTGVAVTLAAFLADGVSDRTLKILLILALNLLTGAVASHLLGRAILNRTPE